MDIPPLLTSAGINIAMSVGLFSLYSVLRKQPVNLEVYFQQRLAQLQPTQRNYFCFDRLVPSASWMVKAWEATDEDIFASGGIDAVVFVKVVVFSMRVFSIAAILCTFLVLPLNFFGQGILQTEANSDLDIFTIGNVREGSRWLWAHCFTLYVISACACTLLYFEYKNVAKMRLDQVNRFPTRPGPFTVLVRGIPWSPVESYSDTVGKFFSNYYPKSYLYHQIVYREGAVQSVQQLMTETERMYKMMTATTAGAGAGTGTGAGTDAGTDSAVATPDKQCCKQPEMTRCGLCGASTNIPQMLPTVSPSNFNRCYGNETELREKESEAALVFFRTRYDALVASHTIQSSDPMLWVTEIAPEPHDVFWSNLCVPYKLLWIRKISVFIASVVFSILFLLPTTFVQGLTQLPELQKSFPILRRRLAGGWVNIITGYLPSVVLMIFLYIVPPTMMLFSALEGSVSRSGRKRSACCKVIIFMFWNVFFSNILSGSWIERMGRLTLSSPKDLATLLAGLIPRQATFFMTYVMTSGWSGLSCELMQPVGLVMNWIYRCVLRKEVSYVRPITFPYHTEMSRVLLFGLLGFTFCILAPLMLPFLLVYFFFAYLVYRNQILNVYITKYQTDGLYWPVAHNATIFSLMLTQVVAAIIFGMKKSKTASSFTFLLIICTALFNVFCKNRFLPLFKNKSAQVVINMDRHDASTGRLEEILQQLPSAYYQFQSFNEQPKDMLADQDKKRSDADDSVKDVENMKPVSNEDTDHHSPVRHRV